MSGLDRDHPYILKSGVLYDSDGDVIEYRALATPLGSSNGDAPLPDSITPEEIAASEPVRLSGDFVPLCTSSYLLNLYLLNLYLSYLANCTSCTSLIRTSRTSRSHTSRTS